MNLSTKRILVTGGAGFLGSAVVNLLKKEGCRDIFVPRSKDYDLVEMKNIEALFCKTSPDIVIHLAATVGGIAVHRDHPARMFYDNAIMGLQVMEQARANGVEKFVAFGTTCCYPKNSPMPFKEEDIWDGYPDEITGPYGIAKKIAIVQSQTYRKEYGFNSICLVPVNLYGPNDHFDAYSSHVIPALIKKVLEAKATHRDSIEVWGTGKATREFLYVDDCAEGIITATKEYDKSEPVNLGSGVETPVKELVETICDIMGFEGRLNWNTSMPDGQPRKWTDVSRAREEFGFQARTSLREGLKKTIDWYLANVPEEARAR